VLDHQARPDGSYNETSEVFGELARLAPIIDATRFVASTALLHSEEIGWAWNHIVLSHLMSVQEGSDISTQGRLLRWYSPLYKAKVPVDVLEPTRMLDGYKVVFAPNLYLINPDVVSNLTHYVRQGGTLIVGPKAALKDWNSVFFADIPPCGGLAEVLGTTVKTSPFRWGPAPMSRKRVTMQSDAPWASSETYASLALFDNLEPTGAVVLARHETGDAAITLNSFGAGCAVYLGCEPEERFHRSLIEWLIRDRKLEPVLRTDADVEVTLRVGGGHRLIFVLNHHDEPEEIALDKPYRELISDRQVSGKLVIAGQSACILYEPSA
jgi:beta-galactosidase